VFAGRGSCGKVERCKVVAKGRGKKGQVVWALALALALTAATVQAGLQSSSMATAIDFQALMAEEKRKMMALRTGAAEDGKPKESVRCGGEGLAWQAHADRPVNLATPRARLNIEQYRAAGDLSGVYYIPGFVSEEEARDLVARIDEMPEASWTDLKRRRLQNHGGTPHPDGTLSAPALAL
jgi:hypothetical protein